MYMFYCQDIQFIKIVHLALGNTITRTDFVFVFLFLDRSPSLSLFAYKVAKGVEVVPLGSTVLHKRVRV